MWAGHSSGLLVNWTKPAMGPSVREAVPRREKAGVGDGQRDHLSEKPMCHLNAYHVLDLEHHSFKYQHLEKSRTA